MIEEPWRAVTDPAAALPNWRPILIPVLVIALSRSGSARASGRAALPVPGKKATELGWVILRPLPSRWAASMKSSDCQAELVHMAHKVQLAQQSLRGYLGAVTTGQEEERRRPARELHDDTIQSLIALNQQIQLPHMTAPMRPAKND